MKILRDAAKERRKNGEKFSTMSPDEVLKQQLKHLFGGDSDSQGSEPDGGGVLGAPPIAHAAAIALIASNSSRTRGSAVSFARSVNRSGRDTRGADEAFGSVAAGAFFAATFFFFGGGGRAAAT